MPSMDGIKGFFSCGHKEKKKKKRSDNNPGFDEVPAGVRVIPTGGQNQTEQVNWQDQQNARARELAGEELDKQQEFGHSGR